MSPGATRRCFVLLLAALALSWTRAELAILEQTIAFRRLEMPGGNGELAVINLLFDGEVGVIRPGRSTAEPLADFKGVNVTIRQDGGQEAVPKLSASTAYLASLQCTDANGATRRWNMTGGSSSNGPPRDLMIAPPTDEPGSSFLSSLGGFVFDAEWYSNRLSLVLLMEGHFDGNSFANQGATRSLMAQWDCRVHFSSSALESRLAHVADNSVFAQTTDALTFQDSRCTLAGIERIQAAIAGFMSAVQNVTTKDQLNALEMTSGAVSLFEAWEGCQRLIEGFFTPENGTLLLPPTTQCTEQYGTEAYLKSACCNRDLAFSECCAPTSREMRYTKVGAVNINSDVCRNPEAIAVVLASYVETRESASLIQQMEAQSGSSSGWDTYTEFIGKCNEALISTTCSVNTDCLYSKSCNQQSGTCNFDWENSQGAYAACFVDKMNPTLKAELVRQFGLDALSATLADDFATAFEQRVFDVDCVGPTSQRYRQQWKETVDTNGNRIGYMQPANTTGCLLEKQCNWNRWENTNEAQCTGAPVLAARGSVFCGARNGGSRDLQDVTVPSQCQAVDFGSQNECQEAGSNHVWVSGSQGWQGACVRNDTITLDSCLSGPLCASQRQRTQQQIAAGTYNPFAPTNWDPQCASTVCYHEGWNLTYCEGLRTTAFGLSNDHPLRNILFNLAWNSELGICSVNLRNIKSSERNATSCQLLSSTLGTGDGSFVFQEGHLFRPGQWSTEQECALGRCSIPTLSYFGVNATTCESRTSCTQSCARCKTFARDQSGQNERTLCYSVSIDSSQECVSPGVWEQNVVQLNQGMQQNSTTYNMCVFPYATRQACTDAGMTFKSCADLTTREECVFAPSTPWQYRLLQCTFDAHTDCLTRDECEQQGQCNDWDMQSCSCSPGSGCVCNSGACVLLRTSQDNSQCGGGGGEGGGQGAVLRPTRFGCMNTSVTTEAVCGNLQGGWRWYEKARTQLACESHGTGCKPKESNWGGQLIARNSSECAKCGGRSESQYTWAQGQVVPGQQQELTWTNRSWVTTNQLKQTLSFNKLQLEINNGVAAIFARKMANRLNSVVQKRVATFVPVSRCCGAGRLTQGDCFAVEQVPDAQCVTEPGSLAQVCESPAGSVTFPPGSVQSLSGSVISTSVVLFGVAVANATTPDSTSITTGTLALPLGNLFMQTKDVAPVVVSPATNDVVNNALGVTVGEIISNALVLLETPNITFPLLLCIPVLAGADQDTTAYPVKDFCAITLLVGPPLDLTVEEQGSSLCANVTEFGTYFACNRKTGWATATAATAASSSSSSSSMPTWELWTIISASVVGFLLLVALGYWYCVTRKPYQTLSTYSDSS